MKEYLKKEAMMEEAISSAELSAPAKCCKLCEGNHRHFSGSARVDCKCHAPAKDSSEWWEREFGVRFITKENGLNEPTVHCHPDFLKEFIHKVSQESKRQGIEEVIASLNERIQYMRTIKSFTGDLELFRNSLIKSQSQTKSYDK